MLNKLYNKQLSVFLLIMFIFGLFPTAGFAQANPPLPVSEVRGFNKAVFDIHFNRADREIDPERWLFEARLGIDQAISAWELIAGGLYDNPYIIPEARRSMEIWSEEELERRFSQWLIGRFFGAVIEKAYMDFYELFNDTQKNYSWHLDDEGNIIIDDNTGNPLLIRPGDEGREFSSDLLLWQNEFENHIQTSSNLFENLVTRYYPDLLFYFDKDEHNIMDGLIKESGTTMVNVIKLEFENIAAREERIFTTLRTSDISSLRNKSENESARLFTERLIIETEEACLKKINELYAKIEAAYAGTGDLALLGEEWLTLYKEQFERGLKAWEEAEERFFIRRLEWEQVSVELFSDGRDEWYEAFDKLEEMRLNWEANAKNLLLAGEKLFSDISDELDKSISEAKAEFQTNIYLRVMAGSNKVSALIDIYLTCGSAALVTLKNVEFWLKEYGAEDINPGDSEFSVWLSQEKKIINPENQLLFDEIKKSYKTYTSYYNQAIDIRNKILADFAELIGTDALKDILDPNVSSEDFFLDDYQIALLRAKALVSYWERKTLIAEAVLKYADESGAGRMTETESIIAWEKAKNDYNSAVNKYETELKKLNEINNDLIIQQEELDSLFNELQNAEDVMNRLTYEISILTAADTTNISNVLFDDLGFKYNALVFQYQDFYKTGDEAVYKKLLDYGLKWGISDLKNETEKLLDVFIYGNDTGVLSLEQLEEKTCEGIISEIDLTLRLAAIDLIADINNELRFQDSDYSSADWYSKAKNLSLSDEERDKLFGNKLLDQLITDYLNSLNILLEKRIEFELDVLLKFISEKPEPESEPENEPGDPGQEPGGPSIAEYFLIDKEEAVIIYDVLLELKTRLELGEDYYTDDDDENTIINIFISGGSFYTGSTDILNEYYSNFDLSAGLYSVFNIYGKYSSFVQNETWQITRNSLQDLFSDIVHDIDTEDLPLLDPKEIFDALFEMDGDFIDNAAQFLTEFESCFSLIPLWLETEINNWKTAIIEYFAANAVYKGYDSKYNLNELALYFELLDAENNNTESLNDNNSILYILLLTEAVEKNNKNIAINDKHWRQFLEILNIDIPDTWIECKLEDSLFTVDYYTNRLNESLAMYSQRDSDSDFGTPDLLYNFYIDENFRIDSSLYTINYLNREIYRLGKAYEISLLSAADLVDRILYIQGEINKIENEYSDLRDNYFEEAQKFLNIGLRYENQYNILKNLYDDVETNRFEYEKQDAIRRWAGTAYLDTDNINYNECKNSLINAKLVLDVLSNLYDDGDKHSYNNPAYNELLIKYEQSFKGKLIILEAYEAVSSELLQENRNNERLYNEYQNSLKMLGYIYQDYSDYNLPASNSNWTIKNIINVNEENGLLEFSRNNSWELTGLEESNANNMQNYFKSLLSVDGEAVRISQFEESLRGLAERMNRYVEDSRKLKQWSLAREYLISSLIDSNKDLKFLENYYSGLGEAVKGGSIGKQKVQTGIIFGYEVKDLSTIFNDRIFYHQITNELMFHGKAAILDKLDRDCKTAWDSLSNEEKADLEFYVILSLFGTANTYFEGFSKLYTYEVYNHAYEYVNNYYKQANTQSGNWYTLGLYNNIREINYKTMSNVKKARDDMNELIKEWENNLKGYLKLIADSSLAYKTSCERLISMEGIIDFGQIIDWEHIEKALSETEKINTDDINSIKTYWELMLTESDETYNSISRALNGLRSWTEYSLNKSKNALEKYYSEDVNTRIENEQKYINAEEDFIAGKIDIKTLEEAAKNAYRNDTITEKNYFSDIHLIMINTLSLYLNTDYNYKSDFEKMGKDIVDITEKTLDKRYRAELIAREAEWDLKRMDISAKKDEWLELTEKILENGRNDWLAGKEKIDKAFIEWEINFWNEYDRVSAEWSEAFLAGLLEKEKWLDHVSNAADQASLESFLLLGAEAERLSRVLDTSEPFGIRGSIPETDNLINGLLQAAGINNMYKAFGSINNISNTASVAARRGMGGISIWDASLTKIAASDLARSTNSQIADMEARRLARNARLSADEAIKNLEKSVVSANESFQKNMDDLFIMQGFWRKNGNNYIKDIMKGSTLFQAVITEKVTVEGYRNYTMDPITLQTNMDEDYLAGLNSIVIMALIENVYSEIDIISGEIFGFAGETINDRGQQPGKFGAYIGYEPDVKSYNEMDLTGKSIKRVHIFHDEGEGEQGKLLSSYIYWNIIDDIGNSELNLAPWDKRIWNDDGSFFDAPSLRTVGSIAGAVATAAITGGASLLTIALMSTASEFVFGVLDVAFNYKSFDEAAFDVGKTFAMNLAAGYIGAGFEKLTKITVNAVNDPVLKILTNTAMTGAQTATTTLVSTTFNAITYNSQDGLGWSREVFRSGMDNMLVNSLSSMASTFVSSTLTSFNSGLEINNIAGSLVGQGVNYAMGGDFTLNILNASMFSNETINTGLLELHLGRNGMSMKLGTGGANVSIDYLGSSVKNAIEIVKINRIKKQLMNSDILQDIYEIINHISDDEWEEYLNYMENDYTENEVFIEMEEVLNDAYNFEQDTDGEMDNFFLKTKTNSDYQNTERYAGEPLLNTVEKTEEINNKKLDNAFNYYIGELVKEEMQKENANPNEYWTRYEKKHLESDDLREKFMNDTKLQEKYGYKPVDPLTIYNVGCVLFSIKYGIEAVKGNGSTIDTFELNEFIVNNISIIDNALLSNKLFAETMDKYLGPDYTVTLVNIDLIKDITKIYDLDKSNNQIYLSHLRIKGHDSKDGKHSVMVEKINFIYNEGIITGIDSIVVANSWDGKSYYGRSTYTLNEIVRWDVLMIK